MAKILKEKDGRYVMEMTQVDWNKLGRDFKSGKGKNKTCMTLIPNKGSCIVDVEIVAEQDLVRTLSKRITSNYHRNTLEIGQRVTITEQTASTVEVVTENGVKFTLNHTDLNEHWERWAFTEAELNSSDRNWNANDEFLCTCPYEDGKFIMWHERGIVVQRNGVPTNPYGDGTVGVSEKEMKMIEDGEPAFYSFVEGHPEDVADEWRDVLVDQHGNFVR